MQGQERLTPLQKQQVRRRKLLHGRAAQGFCILAVFAVLGAVCSALVLLRQDKTFSENENRVLTQRPALTWQTVADGSFAEKLTDWYADQFPGRDGWMSVELAVQRLMGVRELSGVYLGEDDYLIQAQAEPDTQELEKTQEAIRAFAAQYPEIRTTALIAPNAYGVLTQKLPADAPVDDQQTLIDAIDQTLTGVVCVNTTQTLRAHSAERLYYRTDHHWTSLAARYAFEAVAAAMELPDTVPGYTVYTVSDSFEGTLASQTGSHAAHDTIEIYVPDCDVQYAVTYPDAQKTVCSLYEREKLAQKNQYEVFFGGNHARVEIQTTADTGRTLLLLKDSYANCFVQFLTPYFDRIIMIDPRYYYDDLGALLRREAVTDALILYNYNTFVQDHTLSVVLQSALSGAGE